MHASVFMWAWESEKSFRQNENTFVRCLNCSTLALYDNILPSVTSSDLVIQNRKLLAVIQKYPLSCQKAVSGIWVQITCCCVSHSKPKGHRLCTGVTDPVNYAPVSIDRLFLFCNFLCSGVCKQLTQNIKRQCITCLLAWMVPQSISVLLLFQTYYNFCLAEKTIKLHCISKMWAI